MAKHRKLELLNVVAQSIHDCGWNILYASDVSQHPFELKVYQGEESFLLRIYIWNLTHGGGKARPENEYRIQITGVNHFECHPEEKTLILGWWDKVRIFAGFDYSKHSGILGMSPSIQIREESLFKASINGFASCNKGNNEIAIAFRPDFFMNYVQLLTQLHDFGNSEQDLDILEKVLEQPFVPNMEPTLSSTQRQTTLVQLRKKLRDTSFSARVLTAYGNRCAFSGMQLKLIDAAHILPVSSEGSTDETSNGIALSALYHRAYDRGLVTFDEQFKVIVNEKKLEMFKKFGLDGGIDKFKENLRPIIHLPPASSDRPKPLFVKRANLLRGWEKI